MSEYQRILNESKNPANWQDTPDPTTAVIDALRQAVVAQTALLRELSQQVRIGFEALKPKEPTTATEISMRARAEDELLRIKQIILDLPGIVAGLAERLEKLEPSKELDELRQWKREAIEVMPDYQEIGKILGLKCGDTVHDKIIPALRALQSKKNQSLTSKNSKHGAARRKAKR